MKHLFWLSYTSSSVPYLKIIYILLYYFWCIMSSIKKISVVHPVQIRTREKWHLWVQYCSYVCNSRASISLVLSRCHECVCVRARPRVIAWGILTWMAVSSTWGREFSTTPQGFTVTADFTTWRQFHISSLIYFSCHHLFFSLPFPFLCPFSSSLSPLMRYCGGKHMLN